jgi:ComF family protein
LKYERRYSLGRELALLMRQYSGVLLDGVECTVPVPLHRGRLRARGFNQAELLAAGLGLPVAAVLRRTRPTRSQTELPSSQRHRNVRGAFALIQGPEAGRLVLNRCVLVVDDVSTTGATIDACARVLKLAGAREVRALTAARVSTRPR